jgi:lipopolysaccharide export system permease protein
VQLIDRYVLKLFLLYFVGALVVFVTLYLAVDVMTFGLRFADVGLAPLSRYYMYHTPWVVLQLLPMAALAGTLFALSSLHRSHELTALFSLGNSLWRVSLPILLAVGGVSLLGFVLSDQLLPKLIQKRNFVEFVEIKKRPGLYSTVKTNKIWYRSENILFNIKTLNAQERRARGLTLYFFDTDWRLTQLIAADSVQMAGSSWELKDGLVTLFTAESSFPLTRGFQSKTIAMNEDLNDIQTSANASETMSLRELGRFIDRNRDAGLDTLRYEVDYHAKFGFALSSLVMCLLGIPFAVGATRSGGMFLQIGVCLGVTFLYWVSFSSGLTLGQHGALPPVVAAWGPNGLVALVAAFFLRRVNK